MSLKQLALAALFGGALMAPAYAQTAAPAPAPRPTTAAPAPVAAPPVTTPPATAATPPATTMAPKTGLTNINTASAADLDKLPQIGKVRSAAIIKGRPYKTTDDLLTKKILTKGVFDKIKDKITV